MALTLDKATAIVVTKGGGDVALNNTADYKRQPQEGVSRELIKAMAMDAGKSLCAYLEVMFPEVWHGQNSGFKISMKHHVYNDIMSLAELHDEAAIRKRLALNEAHRKEWVGAYRKMRRAQKKTAPNEAAQVRKTLVPPTSRRIG